MALADGELDLGFSPPAELGSNSLTAFAVIGGQAYVSGTGLEVSRLRDDGSIDPGWHLTSPRKGATAISGLPFGGLAMAFQGGGTMIQHDDGSYVTPRAGGFWASSLGSVLPQDDGSVTFVSMETVSRIEPDGERDEAFQNRFPRLNNNSPSPGFRAGVMDSQRRYVLIGSFQTRDTPVRSGLIRLLPDGSVDAGWNPWPDLQADPGGNGSLEAYAIVALPDDSVLVLLNKEFVWINEQGKVTKRIPNTYGNALFPSPVVQPDGKIIVAGYSLQGGGAPGSGLVRLNVDGTLDPSFSVTLDRALIIKTHLDARGRLWFGGLFTEVNGVKRPGIARIQAYSPEPTNTVALQAIVTAAPRHVATNESLYLAARVNGVPEPALQWLRDGVPIDGATNRGLRLAITNGAELGAFSLTFSNAFGAQQLDFPATALARRSPQPGQEDLRFSRGLTNFIYPTHLVPLPDGRILVGSGNPFNNDTSDTPLVGRLLPSGGLDSSFGEGGIVNGQGHVETVVPLPGGGLLVTGDFTELGGQAVQGLAELDHTGRVLARPFPSLDVVHVSTALPLPDGRLLIAGRFTKVGNVPAFRLARLNADLTPDATFHSPIESPRFVDALALDLKGRVLVAGTRTYGTNDQVLTNPPSLGLVRLLADGAPDPAFHALSVGVRTIYVEPDGRLLVGMPAYRLEEDGTVLTVFATRYSPHAFSSEDFFLGFEPNHLMVRTSDGGVIYRADNGASISGAIELVRWKASGEFDFDYSCNLALASPTTSRVTAMARLADDSVLLSTFAYDLEASPIPPEVRRRLRLVPRDSDVSLKVKGVNGGQFQTALETQPGLTYEVYRREQLTGGTPTKLGEYSGDGYVIDLQTPATGNATYLELRRQ